MRDVTRDTMVQIASFDWFANVLRPNDNPEVIRVAGWEEAMLHANGEIWSSCQLQISNRLARRVRERDYARSLQWNRTAAELREAVNALLVEVIDPISARYNLPESFKHCVQWDVIAACMEAECADVYPPQFFLTQLAPIYRQGRFPCGWSGPLLEPDWMEEALSKYKLYVL